MAIPDYADERSYKYFTRGFVGSSHGDDGSSYRMSWNSRCDAEPTKMIQGICYHPVCAYCGNQGLPLQPYIDTHRDYTITDYTCVCKSAMDEVDWRQQVAELENKHHEEMSALNQSQPKPDLSIVKNILKKELAEAESVEDILRLGKKLNQLHAG